MSIKYLDMFSGIGGFRSGLEAVGGFECIGYCEIDQYARRAYEAMYDTKGEMYFEDATKINPDDLPDIDLITGGFPCQAFSIAGRRNGFADTRGTLFFEIARIAAVKKPALLFLENVPGLLSHDKGRTFATILNALDEIGYDVSWTALNSANFGVPQARKRVYITGFLRGKCTGEVFAYTETNPKTIINRLPGSEGCRVYASDGLGVTLTAGGGGGGGKTGLYLIPIPVKSKTKSGYQLAKQISEFDNTQLAAYNALLPLVVGEYYESELISIKDLINLTYSVDDYPVASNIFNDTELGEMLIDNGMFEGIENLSDEMIEFLDAEKIGEAHRIEENGVYVNGCYISREGFEPKEVFNGESLPDNAVDNYLFRLDIADDGLLQNWITVPLNENSERFFNLTNVTEFKLIDFESAIPQISKYADGMHNKITLDELQRINELAKGFLFLDEIQSIKFKAALFYEGINTLEDMDKIESILKNVDSYNLKYFNVYPSDFAKDYLKEYLDEAFPKEYLELIDTNALGDMLMGELQGGYTPYGILLKSSNEQILSNESKHECLMVKIWLIIIMIIRL